jgi:hypothetical protein
VEVRSSYPPAEGRLAGLLAAGDLSGAFTSAVKTGGELDFSAPMIVPPTGARAWLANGPTDTTAGTFGGIW